MRLNTSLTILGTESNEIILISLCGCAAELHLHADRFLHYAESRFSHMSHVMKTVLCDIKLTKILINLCINTV